MEETKKCKKNVRLPWKTKDFLTITSFLPWKTTKKQEITLVFHGRHKKRNKGLFPNRSAKSWWCLTLCKTLRGLALRPGAWSPRRGDGATETTPASFRHLFKVPAAPVTTAGATYIAGSRLCSATSSRLPSKYSYPELTYHYKSIIKKRSTLKVYSAFS